MIDEVACVQNQCCASLTCSSSSANSGICVKLSFTIRLISCDAQWKKEIHGLPMYRGGRWE